MQEARGDTRTTGGVDSGAFGQDAVLFSCVHVCVCVCGGCRGKEKKESCESTSCCFLFSKTKAKYAVEADMSVMVEGRIRRFLFNPWQCVASGNNGWWWGGREGREVHMEGRVFCSNEIK